MNIANRIQYLRKSKGFSQKALADRLAVSQQAVPSRGIFCFDSSISVAAWPDIEESEKSQVLACDFCYLHQKCGLLCKNHFAKDVKPCYNSDKDTGGESDGKFDKGSSWCRLEADDGD